MAALEPKRHVLRPHAKDPALDLHTMTEEYVTYGHRLEPHIADTAMLCHETLERDGTVVFEGAQGTLLDIDHGTYPFVTSSNPIAGAACVGAGRGPEGDRRGLGRRQGLRDARRRGSLPHRARTTRSGGTCSSAGTNTGPPPGASAAAAGSTWSALRYAARINGLTGLVVTKLDVLAGIEPLRVCTSYRNGEGAVFEDFPYHQSILHNATAVTETHPGSRRRSATVARSAELPGAARDYLELHRRFRRRAGEAGRRRPGPRAGDLGGRRPAHCAPSA